MVFQWCSVDDNRCSEQVRCSVELLTPSLSGVPYLTPALFGVVWLATAYSQLTGALQVAYDRSQLTLQVWAYWSQLTGYNSRFGRTGYNLRLVLTGYNLQVSKCGAQRGFCVDLWLPDDMVVPATLRDSNGSKCAAHCDDLGTGALWVHVG